MTSSARPLVSIVIPSFNQGRFIRETIDSCLAQDWRPLEILVIDGGSRDETLSVLQSYTSPELQWISEPDRGVVDAVNKGLARATGEILTIQSSDDVFLPGAITAAVEALASSPHAGLVYGDVELIDEHSSLLGADRQASFNFSDYLGRLQYIPQPGTCFRRRVWIEAGGWRETVAYAADADLWMRIACRYPVIKLDQAVAQYRYHDEQRDTQRERIARDASKAALDLIASGLLDAHQRRYARMGLHLIQHRYSDPADWPTRTRALYGALLINPGALFDPRFPKRDLIPGRDRIWAWLSGWKRRLGFKRRTG